MAANYLDKDGLAYLWSKLKSRFSNAIHVTSLPYVSFQMLPSSTSQSTGASSTFFKEWIQYMVQNQPDRLFSAKVICGVAKPSVTGVVVGYCYGDRAINSDNLPNYCEFIFIPVRNSAQLNVISFGTYNYVFHFGGLNASTVGGHTVAVDVPADAKFTDTVTIVDSELSTTSTNPVQNQVISNSIGAANGIASLGSDGKVPSSQLPDSLSGLIDHLGDLFATENVTVSVTYTAGTVGTRGANVSCGSTTKTGYTYIGATILNHPNSDKFNACLTRTDSNTTLYVTAYRASTAAVSNASVKVRKIWAKV